jgi:hypothetical protein
MKAREMRLDTSARSAAHGLLLLRTVESRRASAPLTQNDRRTSASATSTVQEQQEPMALMQAYEPRIESCSKTTRLEGRASQVWWSLQSDRNKCNVVTPFLAVSRSRSRLALSCMRLQAAAALLGAHSPEAMKLRANGMPRYMSVSFSHRQQHFSRKVLRRQSISCTLLCSQCSEVFAFRLVAELPGDE